jgi:CO/xanthine dehydrogenase FAD-binding subunit
VPPSRKPINSIIQNRLSFIYDALLKFGAWGIRTMATIGGSVFTSFPWSDVTPLLMVLDAKVHILSKNEERLLPIDNFLDDRKKYMKGYLLKEIIIDKSEYGEQRGFKKIALSSFDLALLNFAYIKSQDFIRIAIGARPGRPIRLKKTEKDRSIETAIEEANLGDDFRVSKTWREEVLRALLNEVIA